jgi:hypothetical protein
VGIVTLQTPREVAAGAGVPIGSIPIADERIGAVVVTGSQIRHARALPRRKDGEGEGEGPLRRGRGRARGGERG